MQESTPLIVGAAQMHPSIDNPRSNLATIDRLMKEAAEMSARLLVFPELATSGYMFGNQLELSSVAERIPGGPIVEALQAMCAAHDMHIVVGIPEEDNGSYYNSAVLIAPDGWKGTYRKVHLWGQENVWFQPGQDGFPVFETRIGRIGIVNCYDCWFPESFRTLALAGADVICVPTNWVPIPGQVEGKGAMANILCQAGAHSNGIYIVAADRVGVERGQEFIGQSIIVDYTGWPLDGPASKTEEALLFASLDFAEARQARKWNEYNDPIANRRPDQYHSPEA